MSGDVTILDVVAHLSLVGRAEAIARHAHDGQVDQAGEPYIGHLERVVATIRAQGGPRVGIREAVAWLHDVLEDTPTTLDDLRAWEVPPHVLDVVIRLTHPRGEPLAVYWTRVRADEDARAVKLADVDDNADPVRLARLDPQTRARLAGKYARARAALT